VTSTLVTVAAPNADRWLAVRIVLTVLGTLAIGPVVLFTAIVWVFRAGEVARPIEVVLILAVIIVPLAPLLAFVLLAFTPPPSSGRGLRQIPVVAWVCSGLEFASIAIIIVMSVQWKPPIGLPIGLISFGVVELVLALVFGPRLRMPVRDARELVLIPWRPLPKRSWRMFEWVAACVFVVVATLVLVVFHPWNIPHPTGIRETLPLIGCLLAVGIGSLVTSIVCTFMYLPLAIRLNTDLGRDRAARQRIARIVFRPQTQDPDPIERELARRFAALSVAVIPAQVVSLAFLYAGIIADESESALIPHVIDSWLSLGVIVVLIATLAAMALLMVRRRDRARSFLKENGEPDTASVAAPEPVTA
jgi:hypothetical protein